MKPLVYIILLNYNYWQDTIECVRSLENIVYDNYKVVIVENGSTNDSYERISSEIKDHKIINSGKNLGFAGGNNLGITYGLENGADYILLLNNDTTVEPDFLTKMVETIEGDSKIGVVGCQINYYDKPKQISYGGGDIDWKNFKSLSYDVDLYKPSQLTPREVTFVSGCCMLVSNKVLNTIGLLDDSYFMYYEDTDFSARVSEAGFKMVHEPKAIIYHKISQSSGGDLSPFVLFWSTKNRRKFKNKFKHNVSAGGVVIFNIKHFSTRIVKCFIYLVKGEKEKSKAILKGLFA